MSYEKRYKQTIEETKRHMNYVERQGDPVFVDAEFDSDPCGRLLFDTTFFKIASGPLSVKNWIEKNGFVKTTRKESTCLLTVGKKSDSGCWIAGEHKNYWLKPAV